MTPASARVLLWCVVGAAVGASWGRIGAAAGAAAGYYVGSGAAARALERHRAQHVPGAAPPPVAQHPRQPMDDNPIDWSGFRPLYDTAGINGFSAVVHGDVQ